MTAELRDARLEDLSQVMIIEDASFETPWPESAFRSEFSNDTAVFKVATENGAVVGYYDLWIIADESHLLNIAIAPNRRRTGLGRVLLNDAIAVATARRCGKLFLEVRPSNKGAQRLYAAGGFVKIARRRRYYEDGEDALVMAKELKT